MFRGLASKVAESSLFLGVKDNLKKANMRYAASSYLSLCFFISLIVLILL